MVDRLSDAKVKDYRRVFDEYKTGNNIVEYRYLEKMLRKLGYDPSENDMESVYAHLDVFCNGDVSFAQFLTLMANKFNTGGTENEMNEEKEEDEELLNEMKAAFRVFDGDGNGFISQAELKHTLINMGEKLSDDDIEDMMKEADTDGDGQISFPEFCRMLTLQELYG
ncbi:neo-calmodulin-like [Ruditapes philippinarum]|uniref:neo-calmodulin-like n=1 Tax=Ruditapes philippinarum TaxID=129788 RepID=UPI00295AC7FB|nr:neo-calmodulin-like [Ruditapes philippinarum]